MHKWPVFPLLFIPVNGFHGAFGHILLAVVGRCSLGFALVRHLGLAAMG